MKQIVIIIILCLCSVCQSAFAGDWTKRYGKDAFGDTDYSYTYYTTELSGTTNLIRPGESCVLCVVVAVSDSFPLIRVFLERQITQNFFSDTTVTVKLSSGKKFDIPCDVDKDGSLWLGKTPKDCWAIIDIFDKGHFTLAITSMNSFDRMNCLFSVGTKTTGIRNLISK